MKLLGRNKVILIEPKEEKTLDQKDKVENASNLDLIIKQKNFRQEKYLQLLKKFIEECCDYEFMNMISHNEIKEAYNKFLRESDDPIKNLNISFSLSSKDIPSLDNRFTYKRVHLCKSCGKRQFTGCCDNYNIKNRTSIYYMINLKLK